MFKLIIVDDEKITRDSLVEYIPWSELGVEVVGSAKNGLAALEIAEQARPDIMLCDVRMPKMDGIELASKVKELYPDCKIIFLSGYSDKEYLKSAIKLKAVSYIEKPINIQEIQAVIQDTVSICREEGKRKAEDKKVKNHIIESIPFIRQKIALDLIKGESDARTLGKRIDDSIAPFPLEGPFIVAAAVFNWVNEIEVKERNSIEQSILQKLYHHECLNSKNFVAGFTEFNILAFIIAAENRSNEEVQDHFIGKIHEFLLSNSQEKFSISVGVSLPADNLNNIPPAYLAAVDASKMQFYFGVNKIFRHKDMVCSQFSLDKDMIPTFKDLLRKGSLDEASDLVMNLSRSARECRYSNINYVKNIYFNLLLSVFEIAREVKPAGQTEGYEKKYIWQDIDNIKTLAELSDYVLSTLEASFGRNEEKSNANRKICEIMRYIEEHYAERDLSVQSIANHVYLSHTYLCAFFKKSTGKTVNEYITEVRIEKAKEFLKDNRVKLYEVATNVGFMDANYFSTLFKKNTGLTPSEFRERYPL